MLMNYVKIAIRNLWREKYFAIINLSGLSLGISCSIFIFLWVNDELSYDRFHKHGKHLFRVMETQFYAGGDIQTGHSTPGLLAEALQAEIPEISHAVKMTWESQELLTVGKESHKEKGRYASPEFFEMFTFPLTSGNSKTALLKPYSVVISGQIAERYFGDDNPVGKMIRLNNSEDYEVTGILADIPFNSSLRFDFVLPIEHFEKVNQWLREWGNNGVRTYILLRADASPAAVEAKIKDFIKQKLPKATVDLFIQPYAEMYLHDSFKNGKQDGGRIDYVQSFSVVAVVVLVIACINFMNLSTARSLKRAKEIGIRKTNGASRKSLIFQFMSEACAFSFLAMLFAVFLVELLLPVFRQLTGKEIHLHYNDPGFLLTLAGIAIATGIISGIYPSVFLSSFNTLNVLKGTLKFATGSTFFRKGLVVFQFCLTTVLIFCTIVVYRQMEFIKTKNLGFDRENLAYLVLEGDLLKNLETFQQEASRLPGIKSVAVASANPLEAGSSTVAVNWPGKLPDEQVLFTQIATGSEYVKTMDLTLLEGRDFSQSIASDTSAYLVNEETVKKMRLQDPVGQTITFWNRPGKIIGVIKNFHLNSLHTAIEPLIIHNHPAWTWYLIARIEKGRTVESMDGLARLTARLNPAYPFEYHFVDETFEQQYKSETTVGTLANYFAFLAITISCLGLLGLIIFAAEQRTKEIGIRKVLGATIQHIVVLLSKDFILLIAIAFILSSPLAYYVMKNWLLNFAYHTDIGWTVFMAAGVVSFLVAFLTVGIQAWKAATSNPSRSLRAE